MLLLLAGVWFLWSAVSLGIALASFLLEGTAWELDHFWDYIPITWIVPNLLALILGFFYLGIKLLLWG